MLSTSTNVAYLLLLQTRTVTASMSFYQAILERLRRVCIGCSALATECRALDGISCERSSVSAQSITLTLVRGATLFPTALW